MKKELTEWQRKADAEAQCRADLERDVKRLERELEEAQSLSLHHTTAIAKEGGAEGASNALLENKLRELEKRWESERKEKEERDREIRRLKDELKDAESRNEEELAREKRAATTREKNTARETEEAKAQADKLKRELDAERARREKAEQQTLEAENLAKGFQLISGEAHSQA